MTWIIVAVIVFFTALFVVGNIRVWRGESIRTKSLEIASMVRSNHIQDSQRQLLKRAYEYEDFVRKGQPKDQPPPTQPPRRSDE